MCLCMYVHDFGWCPGFCLCVHDFGLCAVRMCVLFHDFSVCVCVGREDWCARRVLLAQQFSVCVFVLVDREKSSECRVVWLVL